MDVELDLQAAVERIRGAKLAGPVEQHHPSGGEPNQLVLAATHLRGLQAAEKYRGGVGPGATGKVLVEVASRVAGTCSRMRPTTASTGRPRRHHASAKRHKSRTRRRKLCDWAAA